jgi:hypothetical protein
MGGRVGQLTVQKMEAGIVVIGMDGLAWMIVSDGVIDW